MDIGYLFYASPWVVGECVTTDEFGNVTPHLFKTGDFIQFGTNGAWNGIVCTNGPAALGTINLSQAYPIVVWVTGASTFAFVQSMMQPANQPTGLPGGVNGVKSANHFNPPITVTINVPSQGTMPHRALPPLINALSTGAHKTACWLNIPIMATDAWTADLGAQVFAVLDPACDVWMEYGNENWNLGQTFFYVQQIGRIQGLNRQAANVRRSYQHYQTLLAAATTAGWTGRILHMMGAQKGNPLGTITPAVAYANANAVPIHGFLVDSYCDAPTDQSVVLAAASMGSSNINSIASGTWFSFDQDMYQELMRHSLLWNVPISNLYAQCKAEIARYNVANMPTPMMCAYEGGIAHPIPNGVQVAGNTTLRPALSADVILHRGMYDLVRAWALSCQNGGFNEATYFHLCNIPGGSGNSTWCLTIHESMQPGLGDGTDGKTVNPRAVGPTLTADPFFLAVSPGMQAIRDWMDGV